MFRCKVLRPLSFLFVWNCIQSIGIFFIARRKCIDLVVVSNKGRGETSALSLRSHKRYGCIKYLTLGQQAELMALNFTMFLYSVQNEHNSGIAEKFTCCASFWTGQTFCLFLSKKRNFVNSKIIKLQEKTITTVLRKADGHLVVICRLIKDR